VTAISDIYIQTEKHTLNCPVIL